jgi:tetratricopeptide (TPR) repeat protein
MLCPCMPVWGQEPFEIPKQSGRVPTRTEPSPKTEAQPATLKPPSIDARDFLSKTEAYIRAPRAAELLPLGRELRDRGFEQAAEQVFEALPRAGEDLGPLVEQCLQTGQLSAAESILEQWRRSAPRDPRAATLGLVLQFAQGQTELALRELPTAQELATDQEKPMVELIGQLLRQQMRGGPVGIENNPWGANFIGPDGVYVAGGIAPAEAAKIPPGTTDAMLRLVNMVPKQGNLWALLGELVNASGDPTAALRCLDRARILLYTPPLLREHLRVLEDYQRQADEAARKAMDQALPAETAAPAVGWSNLSTRREIFIILVVGGALAVAIAILQLREWTKPSRKS